MAKKYKEKRAIKEETNSQSKCSQWEACLTTCKEKQRKTFEKNVLLYLFGGVFTFGLGESMALHVHFIFLD